MSDFLPAEQKHSALAKDSNGQSSSNESPNLQISIADFLIGKTLGEGAFARVVHARSKTSNKDFAIKIMSKAHIKKENKVKYVKMEIKILIRISHPLIVQFHFSFQDSENLFVCMDLAPGGELLSLISRNLSENQVKGISETACDFFTSRFYLAEIVEALEYLHALHIIHRDLKPENILIMASGHIKVTDFGTSTILSESETLVSSESPSRQNSKEDSAAEPERSSSSNNSFVGTQDYVSPEVLAGEASGVTKACDLWALGCILYQLFSGRSPFAAMNEYLCFERIKQFASGQEPLDFPASIPHAAVDLINKLLVEAPSERLGAGRDSEDTLTQESCGNGYRALKNHEFFTTSTVGDQAPLPWGSLHLLAAPYTPQPMPTSVMRDGASDAWLFELDDDNEESSLNNEEEVVAGGDGRPSAWGLGWGGKQAQGATNDLAHHNERWQIFLNENERLVFSGLIFKRVGLFSKKRQLILTDGPRLLYVDPDSMDVKGEIPWTVKQPVSCHLKSKKEFDVFASSTGRIYHLADAEKGASAWVEIIESMVRSTGYYGSGSAVT